MHKLNIKECLSKVSGEVEFKYEGSVEDNTEESYNNLLWLDTRSKPSFVSLLEVHVVDQVNATEDKIKELKAELEAAKELVKGAKELAESRAETFHSHPIGFVLGLEDELKAKASVEHTHSMHEVVGLEEALGAKCEVKHEHVVEDVKDLTAKLNEKLNNKFVLKSEPRNLNEVFKLSSEKATLVVYTVAISSRTSATEGKGGAVVSLLFGEADKEPVAELSRAGSVSILSQSGILVSQNNVQLVGVVPPNSSVKLKLSDNVPAKVVSVLEVELG